MTIGDGAPGTVILSYRLWQTEFGGDRFIVGRSLIFDDKPYTVLGVMPREFHFPGSDSLFWTTNRFGERDYQRRGAHQQLAERGRPPSPRRDASSRRAPR